MKTFRLTAEAAGDITNIFNSIAQDSIDAAQRVGAEIYEEMKKLARNPRVGHKRQDLTSRELLFCAVYSYLIIYQPDTKPVNIIAVLHGRRNVKNPLKSAELGLPAILLFGTHEIKFAECTRNPPSGPSLVRTSAQGTLGDYTAKWKDHVLPRKPGNDGSVFPGGKNRFARLREEARRNNPALYARLEAARRTAPKPTG